MTTHQDKLREEFLSTVMEKEDDFKFFENPYNTADWWLSRTLPTAALQALVEKIEGKILDKIDLYDGQTIAHDEGFNQALSLAIAELQGLLKDKDI